MRRLKAICVTIVVLTLTLGAACAPLPDVAKLAQQAQTEKPPRILTARGMLSGKKSKAIMERLQGPSYRSDLLLRHSAVMEMVTGTPLTGGNKARLLVDGRTTFAAISEAIRSATDSINLEIYKIDNDAAGRMIADLLLKKQQAGVQVNIIYDGLGSLLTPPSFFDTMRKAGAQVVGVNPLKGGGPAVPGTLHADHRKLLVVDGTRVITGGVNISQVYTSTPFSGKQSQKAPVPWRDTDVEIEGPAAVFQELFVGMWLRQKGPPLSRARYFPPQSAKGNALVQAIGSTPGESNRITYISYLCAMIFAKHAIHITNAYFIPDDHTLDALTDAARRGVDVKIIVPSITDSNAAYYAMRYNYAELLKAGVKLYERRHELLHAKTAVIDGVWSTVGSTNMDFLSLSRNYEINAIVLGPKFGSQMEWLFDKDLAESKQITWEKWKHRSLWERTRELLAHAVSHLL
ncbi:phospholipase D-like domain-containing protein [Geomonas sp. Red32]|uniref:phospholipase D-like domain-containing protein n=1 Tax=Geomonas sp. Red32 TaxID=2912856 RepID=UPI00202D09D6|nr:phospholipase D-like domain-containing protein [Geomonas sp. Red32]MCM0080854.1 phospholipase D-like domain-containing protein [Geomonas sp. Red32]